MEITLSGVLVLKLHCAVEALGGLVKTQIAGSGSVEMGQGLSTAIPINSRVILLL